MSCGGKCARVREWQQHQIRGVLFRAGESSQGAGESSRGVGESSQGAGESSQGVGEAANRAVSELPCKYRAVSELPLQIYSIFGTDLID